jgi:hypothetical protein
MVDGIAMGKWKKTHKETHKKGGCQVKLLLPGIYYEKVIKSINKP